MSRRLLALALLVPFVAGCGLIYKSKAQKWGNSLKEIQTKLNAVNSTAQSAGMKIVTDRDIKEGILADLDEITALVMDLRDRVGTGGHPAHGDLLEGLDLLLDAVDAFIEMIDFSNPSKMDEYEELALAGRDKLESWGAAVRGPQTG